MSTTLRPRGILKETRYGGHGPGHGPVGAVPRPSSSRTLDSLLDGPAPAPPMEQIQILYGSVPLPGPNSTAGVGGAGGDAVPGSGPATMAMMAAGLPPMMPSDASSACSSLEDSLEGRGVVMPQRAPQHALPPSVPVGGAASDGECTDLDADPAARLDRTLGSASAVRPEERAELVGRVTEVLAGIHEPPDDDDESDSHEGGECTVVPVKEYTIINFPNGDLFSGNVDSESGELVYGRMTCPIEMETYEGPFRDGTRHGDGATCSKMDGSAKFLGR